MHVLLGFVCLLAILVISERKETLDMERYQLGYFVSWVYLFLYFIVILFTSYEIKQREPKHQQNTISKHHCR